MEANNGSCHLFGQLIYTKLEVKYLEMDVLRLLHRHHGNPESIYHLFNFYSGETKHSVTQSLNQGHADQEQQIKHSKALVEPQPCLSSTRGSYQVSVHPETSHSFSPLFLAVSSSRQIF